MTALLLWLRMSREKISIVGLVVTAPLAVGCAMILWVAWEMDVLYGLMPPYIEDEWREFLSLMVFAAICLGWIMAFVITIRMYRKNIKQKGFRDDSISC